METERKIAALAAAASKTSARMMAMELIITSLISTHPDRPALKAVIQANISGLENAMLEAGFADGHAAGIAGNAVAEVKAQIAPWLKACDM